MSEFFTGRSFGDFLFGFGALFAIINPYGMAFVFLDRTVSLSESERARIAFRVAIYAFCVLLVSMFVGSEIMRFFGISMPACGSQADLWSRLPAGRCFMLRRLPPASTPARARTMQPFEAWRSFR